ncbi:hypothetical protein ACNI3Q_00195 [Sphingomonas sp. FW199]|uniref:hypothetical protein n=1 Tax=Sphingomonas sp. FW199 TaxID=3400217 RepID=UPI003CEB2164
MLWNLVCAAGHLRTRKKRFTSNLQTIALLGAGAMTGAVACAPVEQGRPFFASAMGAAGVGSARDAVMPARALPASSGEPATDQRRQRNLYVYVPGAGGQGGYTMVVPEDSPLHGARQRQAGAAPDKVAQGPSTAAAAKASPDPEPGPVAQASELPIIIADYHDRGLMRAPDFGSEDPVAVPPEEQMMAFLIGYLHSSDPARYSDDDVRVIRDKILDAVVADDARTRSCNIMIDGARRNGKRLRDAASDCLDRRRLYKAIKCSTLKARQGAIQKMFASLSVLYKDPRLQLQPSDIESWIAYSRCVSSLDASWSIVEPPEYWSYFSGLVTDMVTSDATRSAIATRFRDGPTPSPGDQWRSPVPHSDWDDYLAARHYSCVQTRQQHTQLLIAIHCAAADLRKD